MSDCAQLIQYQVRTTRSGREYAGVHAIHFVVTPSLADLMKQAVDTEDLYRDPETLQASQGSKRPASVVDCEESDRSAPATKTNVYSKRPGKNAGSHRRRRERKQRSKSGGQGASKDTRQAVVKSSVQLQTTVNLTAYHVQHGAHYALHQHPNLYQPLVLDQHVMQGYKLVNWNGQNPIPLLDDKKRVIGVLAGRPRDDTYVGDCLELFEVMNGYADQVEFPTKQRFHQRGQYRTADVGITYAQGMRSARNLHVEKDVGRISWDLLESRAVKRILGYCDQAFDIWAPSLHSYYKANMNKLLTQREALGLKPISDDTAFACFSTNYGPRAFTVPHRDSMNLAFGWCAIVALGNFNPLLGGHLVLHEPRLVVEFPPASTILIPSSLITHSNIPIPENDARASLAFYSPGGIFRFVENGFRTEAEFEAADPDGFREMLGRKAARWEWGLGQYSTLDDLVIP